MEPDTNDNPSPTGESPASALPVSGATLPRRFNFVVHEAVQRLLSLGVWCDLGPRFGGLRVRLRAFHVQAVVAKREAAERAVRVRLGLSDSDEIPGEESIGITRAAMVMAITDVAGEVNVGDAGIETLDEGMLQELEAGRRALQKARDGRTKVIEEGGPVIVFEPLTGKTSMDERLKHSERVRNVFAPMLEGSITLLTQLFNTSRALQRVRDEEIYRLGEAFVYGRPGEFDWAD